LQRQSAQSTTDRLVARQSFIYCHRNPRNPEIARDRTALCHQALYVVAGGELMLRALWSTLVSRSRSILVRAKAQRRSSSGTFSHCSKSHRSIVREGVLSSVTVVVIGSFVRQSCELWRPAAAFAKRWREKVQMDARDDGVMLGICRFF
jgi:hypothetical protein